MPVISPQPRHRHHPVHRVNDVMITIADDGPGFPAGVLARVGAPWNSSRGSEGSHRGLGDFYRQHLD